MTSKRNLERRLEDIAPGGDLPRLSLAVYLSADEAEVVHDDPLVVECDGERYRSAGLLEQLYEQMDNADEA